MWFGPCIDGGVALKTRNPYPFLRAILAERYCPRSYCKYTDLLAESLHFNVNKLGIFLSSSH